MLKKAIALVVSGFAAWAMAQASSGAVVSVAVSEAPAESNYVFNGSFEMPGTRADGWLQEKNKGWCGFPNSSVAKGKTPEEVAYLKAQKAACTRKIVNTAASDGQCCLAMVTTRVEPPESLKSVNVSNKVYQLVSVPADANSATTFVLTFKVKGKVENERCFATQLKAKHLEPGAKQPTGKLPSVLKAYPVKADEWTLHTTEFTCAANHEVIDLTFCLFDFGEVYVDDVKIVKK